MYQLTDKEFINLRSQFVTSKWGGRRYNPYVFTEQGVAMPSCVLSQNVIPLNIQRSKLAKPKKPFCFKREK
jgi:hypothetical protein